MNCPLYVLRPEKAEARGRPPCAFPQRRHQSRVKKSDQFSCFEFKRRLQVVGMDDAVLGREAGLQGSPREGPEAQRKPLFPCELK
jgi:hypothetical protein